MQDTAQLQLLASLRVSNPAEAPNATVERALELLAQGLQGTAVALVEPGVGDTPITIRAAGWPGPVPVVELGAASPVQAALGAHEPFTARLPPLPTWGETELTALLVPLRGGVLVACAEPPRAFSAADTAFACCVADTVAALRARELQAAEQERLRARLRRTDGLQAVIAAVGAVGHDFNNLFGIIGNFADFIAAEAPAGTDLANDMAQIVDATERARKLNRNLLRAVREQPRTLESLDAAEVMTAVADRAANQLGDRVRIETSTAHDTPSVFLDRGDLEHALLAVVLNAGDASAASGVIECTAGPADDRGQARVRFSVRDSGAGMSPEVLSRATQPFFSTKLHAAGLGLTGAKETAFRAGGDLRLRSVAGEGTVVELLFPPSPQT